MPGPVIIVDYDPQWPTLYEKEKALVCRVLEHRICALEHVGSTAVPKLGGKNIIDIMAGVNSVDEANQCISPLESIGYKDVTPQPDDTEWYYCLGKGPHSPAYHLHLVKFNSEHWKKQIVFRDFLRKNPDSSRVLQSEEEIGYKVRDISFRLHRRKISFHRICPYSKQSTYPTLRT